MRKVLVLGGEGLLGRMVVRVLSQSGEIATEFTSRSRERGHYFDVEDGMTGLERLFVEEGPFHYAINCIGVLNRSIDEHDSKSVRRAIRINALFPHELGDLARADGTKVVQISTDGVFSGRTTGFYFEDAPHDCEDIYGKTKSLGEVLSPGFLNIRCSIVGRDPLGKRGLLEWFLARPEGSVVHGFTDHLWNGVTTLQFAGLCKRIILEDAFKSFWNESPVHHFCPNRPMSKYELLKIFQLAYDKNIVIEQSTGGGGPVRRVLASRYDGLAKFFGKDLDMEQAIMELVNFNHTMNDN